MDSDEALALLLCSGSLLVMANCKKQKNRRRWWRTNLFNSRHGAELLRDLQFQHVSGQYKNFYKNDSHGLRKFASENRTQNF